MEEIYFNCWLKSDDDIVIYVENKGDITECFTLFINSVCIGEYNKKCSAYFAAKRVFMALRPTAYAELCDAIAEREKVVRR